MQKIPRNIICLLLILFTAQKQFAQADRFKEKKYIFLLDITKSMWGCCGAEDIFDDVRDHLIKAINNIPDPKAEIVISTYQEKIINTWEANATPAGKKTLIGHLNNIDGKKVPGQNTNAYGAWKEAQRHLDKNKINIAFILTDGDHNDNNVPIQKFYDEIPKWEEVSNKQQAYIFVVELTKLAIDNKVRDLVKQTKDAQIIHGIEFFILEIKEQYPILNTEDDLAFSFNLDKDNWNPKYNNLPISLSLDSEHFDLDKRDIVFSDLPIRVNLVPKSSLNELKEELAPISYITVEATYPAEKFPQIKLLDNSIKIQINNRKEKVLKLEVVE